jgi:hypothetical protein
MAASSGGGIRQLVTIVGDQQVKAAFNSMGASGEAAFKRLQTAASNVSASLTDVGRHTDTRVTGLTRLAGELSQTTQKMQIFSEFIGTVKGGLLGLVAFEAGRTVFSSLKSGIADSIKGFDDLRKTSSAFALDPNTVKAWGQAMKAGGLQASDASKSLGSFAQVVADGQKDVVSLNNALFPTVGVMKGAEGAASTAATGMRTLRGDVVGATGTMTSLVQVMRDGVIVGADKTSDAFAKVGIDFAKLPQGVGRTEAALKALAARTDQLKLPANFDALRDIAKSFGTDDVDAFRRSLENLNTVGLDKLKAQVKGAVPTAQDTSQLEAFNKAVADLGNTSSRVSDNLASFALGFATLETRGADNFLKGLSNSFSDIGNAIRDAGIDSAASDAFDKIKSALSSTISSLPQIAADDLATLKAALAAFGQSDEGTIWTGLTTGWQSALDIMTQALTAFLQGATSTMTSFTDGLTSLFAQAWANITAGLNQLSDKVQSLGSSISDLFSSAGTASGAAGGNLEGFAGGGFVSGPGSATSDSILAREFVVRAAAVDRVGVPLLQALNGLRTPIVPRTRFATGGLVAVAPSGSAGSGSAVVLVLHNTPHRLTTDSATRDSLLRLGRKSGMVSAGRIPGIA